MKGGRTNIGPRLTRREFVASTAVSALVAASPLSAATLPHDPRLVVILPRGASDIGTGWLNRAAEALRGMGRTRNGNLIAIGSSAPAIMHGPAPVLVCAPGALQCIQPERLGEYLDERGALKRSVVIAAPLVMNLPVMSFPTRAARAGIQESALDGPWIPAPPPAVGNDTVKSAVALGRALAAAQGMRIGVLELNNPSECEGVIATLAQEMASVWRDTIIMQSPLLSVLCDHLGIPGDLLAKMVSAESGGETASALTT